jgi:penicillin amidase
MIFPHVYNPPEGFLATANDWDLPADFPMAKYKIGYEWASYSRITRIKEVLTAKPKLNLADSMALQTDTTSATSRRIVAQLPAHVPDDPVLIQATQMLKSWNNRADVDSAAAALYEVWTSRHLPQAIMAELVPAPARDLVGAGFIDATALVLEGQPPYTVTPEIRSHLDQVIWTSLRAAWDETVSLLGPDPTNWAWGKLHHAWFHSAVSVLADPATAQQLDIQDLAMGGTQLSPMAATYRKNDFSVRAGASIRLVMDVGDWDNSRAINSSGQSGDPYSPHYRDLAPLWTSGEYVPLPFSRAAVEREAAHKIELSPN